jgi:signal transduction histidine kinase
MAGTISAISAADLGERVTPATRGDELGGLSLAFNGLLDRLQTSFERQRRFAAEASHQLRTPLTAMQGQLEVALRRERSSSEYLQTLKTVESQTANLRRIVEMLLAITREPIDADHAQFESLELNTWLGEHVSTWRQHPRGQDLHLDSTGAHALWVRAHAGLLGQAIDNLWDNACKYSNPQTPIKVRTVRGEDNVKLILADGGHGMTEREVSCVADPFYRSDDARARGIEGTGLGLAIVTRIVAAFGAKLHIESAIGRGSVFTIIFPAATR